MNIHSNLKPACKHIKVVKLTSKQKQNKNDKKKTFLKSKKKNSKVIACY